MEFSKRRLEKILEPYINDHLECDGQSKVISYILTKNGIDHKLYDGELVDKESGEGIYHQWIEIDNKLIVDYKARMWYPDSDCWHGIFEKSKMNNRELEYIQPKSMGTPKISDMIFNILCNEGKTMKLSDLLFEAPGPLDKYAFNDRDNPRGIATLQKIKYGIENDNAFEKKLLNKIYNWTNDSDAGLYSFSKPHIDKLATKYPHIFKPKTPNGTILYRGLKNASPNFIKKLKLTDIKDWVISKEYAILTTPVQYSPRSPLQSWTTRREIADSFSAGFYLITKQTSDFYFNSNFLAIIYDYNEREVLHYGKEYKNTVYISIEKDLFLEDIATHLMDKSSKKLTSSKFGDFA